MGRQGKSPLQSITSKLLLSTAGITTASYFIAFLALKAKYSAIGYQFSPLSGQDNLLNEIGALSAILPIFAVCSFIVFFLVYFPARWLGTIAERAWQTVATALPFIHIAALIIFLRPLFVKDLVMKGPSGLAISIADHTLPAIFLYALQLCYVGILLYSASQGRMSIPPQGFQKQAAWLLGGLLLFSHIVTAAMNYGLFLSPMSFNEASITIEPTADDNADGVISGLLIWKSKDEVALVTGDKEITAVERSKVKKISISGKPIGLVRYLKYAPSGDEEMTIVKLAVAAFVLTLISATVVFSGEKASRHEKKPFSSDYLKAFFPTLLASADPISKLLEVVTSTFRADRESPTPADCPRCNAWMVDLDTGKQRQLTQGGGYSHPHISRDGKRLAVLRSGHIEVISLPEGAVRSLPSQNIQRLLGWDEKDYRFLVVDRDGKVVVIDERGIEKGALTGEFAKQAILLQKVNSDGMTVDIKAVESGDIRKYRLIVDHRSFKSARRVLDDTYSKFDASWSGDGKGIVFVTDRPDEP